MTYKDIHSETQLLDRISTGDEAAFAIIYQHYYLQLKPLIRRYTHSEEETEEILQEAFIKVWLNRDKIPSIINFRAWIFKIASREYLFSVRKKLYYEEKLNSFSTSVKAECSVSPFELTNLQEIQRLLLEAVSQMPPQRRLIYELSRNKGLKVEEIAEHLSITSRTVKNVLTTSLKHIREYLIAAGHGPLLFIYMLLNII